MTIRMKDLLVMNNFGVHSRPCWWINGGNEPGGDFICFNFSLSTLPPNQPPTQLDIQLPETKCVFGNAAVMCLKTNE